jgi:hypothetical protein
MMDQEGSGPFYQTPFGPAEPGVVWQIGAGCSPCDLATRVPEPSRWFENRLLCGDTREIIYFIQQA